jgi:hypothetical protein
MANHDIGHLERNLKLFGEELRNLSDEESFAELLKILHHPGWTTPAEFVFAGAITDLMVVQAKALVSLRDSFLEGARQVIETAGE